MILSFEFEVGLLGARVTVRMVRNDVFPLAQHGFLSSGT